MIKIKDSLIISACSVLILACSAVFVHADCSVTQGSTDGGNNGWGLVAQDLGTSFVPSCDGTLQDVIMRDNAFGLVTDFANVTIQTDSGGVPSGVIIGTSDPEAIGAIEPLLENTQFFFTSSPPTLTAGTTYWLVPGRTGARDNANYYNWEYTDTSCSNSAVWDGSWSPLSRCFVFVGLIVSSGPGPTPGGNGFGELITLGTTGFASTTGFSVAMAVGWMSDNIIKLFIGSSMAVLYHLRNWIVALIIIASIIFFAFSAFRFFRH